MSYIGNSPISVAFLTDTFSGTGAQVAFTMTVAPANTSSIIIAVTGVVQDPSTYSVSGTTLTFSTAPPSGTSNISVRYLGIPASGVTTTAYRTVTNTTATASQTSFTIPSYTVGYVDVYRNGVYLPTTDYTATTGTTVVLNTGATSGDTITTISFYVSSVLNAIPNTGGSVSASNLAASGTGSSSNFLRGDMAWTSATGTGAVALASLPSFTTTIGVGAATASASGSGITFPASQSASSNANTLDDYEEGTWTPTLSGTGGATGQSYGVQNGLYTKIGNVVTVSFDVRLSTLGTISGQAVIGGLPFSANGENCGIPIGTFENLGQSIVYLGARLQGGQSYITVFTTTAAASTIGTPNGSTLYTATSKLFGGGSYITS